MFCECRGVSLNIGLSAKSQTNELIQQPLSSHVSCLLLHVHPSCKSGMQIHLFFRHFCLFTWLEELGRGADSKQTRTDKPSCRFCSLRRPMTGHGGRRGSISCRSRRLYSKLLAKKGVSPRSFWERKLLMQRTNATAAMRFSKMRLLFYRRLHRAELRWDQDEWYLRCWRCSPGAFLNLLEQIYSAAATVLHHSITAMQPRLQITSPGQHCGARICHTLA